MTKITKNTHKLKNVTIHNSNLYLPVIAKGNDKQIYKTRLIMEPEQFRELGELCDKLMAEAFPDIEDYLLPRNEERDGKFSILASTIYEPKIINETGIKIEDGDTADVIIKITPSEGTYGRYVVFRLVRIDKR